MKSLKLVLSAVVAVLFFCGISAAQTTTYAPGEVLVKFQNGPSSQSANNINAQLGVTVLNTLPEIGWQRLRIPAGKTVEQVVAEYKASGAVIEAQPNYTDARPHITPNDPNYTSGALYGLNKISAPAAWDVTTGSTNIVVADFDTGITAAHQDLAPNLWRNPGETGTDAQGRNKATNGVDDDSNGYIDDVNGIDVANTDSNPADSNQNGHGTHTAGTIGAAGNNSVGVVGVNWNVRIMPIKIFRDDGFYSGDSAVADAFIYMVNMKNRGVNVRMANHSWGGHAYSQIIYDAFKLAQDNGILDVCSSGNGTDNDGRPRNNDTAPTYPASYDLPGIIAVGASDSNDAKASFSNYGVISVDLMAPGVNIVSTSNASTTAYRYLDGTSMAAPHVTGAAALILAKYPNLSLTQLKDAILSSVDRLSQFSGVVATGGRLNVARALQQAATNDTTAPTSVTIRLPRQGSTMQVLTIASGTAFDNSGGSGIDHVNLQLRRSSDGYYWSGAQWVPNNPPNNPQLVTSFNPATGEWTRNYGFPPASSTPDGAYTLRVVAVDKMGNFNSSVYNSFYLANTPPQVAIQGPANGSTISMLTLINGTASDPDGIARVQIWIRRLSDGAFWDGTKWVTTNQPILLSTTFSSNTWQRGDGTSAGLPTGSNLSNGLTYRIVAHAFDRGGNLADTYNDFKFSSTGGTQGSPTPSSVTLSASSFSAGTQSVTLVFTGALDPATATNVANYQMLLEGTPVAVQSASLSTDGSTVTLRFAAGTLGLDQRADLVFSGLLDAQGRPLADGGATGTVQ